MDFLNVKSKHLTLLINVQIVRFLNYKYYCISQMYLKFWFH